MHTRNHRNIRTTGLNEWFRDVALRDPSTRWSNARAPCTGENLTPWALPHARLQPTLPPWTRRQS